MNYKSHQQGAMNQDLWNSHWRNQRSIFEDDDKVFVEAIKDGMEQEDTLPELPKERKEK